MAEYLFQEETLVRLADLVRAKTGGSEMLTMAQIMELVGSLADVRKVTAEAADVLTGHTFVDAQGNAVDGTMPYNEDIFYFTYPPLPGTGANYDWMAKVKLDSSVPDGYYKNCGVLIESVGKLITPTKALQKFRAGSEFFHEVRVNPIPDEYQAVTAVTALAEFVREGDVFVDAGGTVQTGTLAMWEGGNY